MGGVGTKKDNRMELIIEKQKRILFFKFFVIDELRILAGRRWGVSKKEQNIT